MAIKEELWIKKFEIDFLQNGCVFELWIKDDKQGWLSLCKNKIFNDESKQI